jgi:hypothetical protein
MAVDHALQVHLAYALEMPDEEGVHRNQAPGMRRFDVAFPELRGEPLQQPDLVLVQLDTFAAYMLLQPQQPVVPG